MDRTAQTKCSSHSRQCFSGLSEKEPSLQFSMVAALGLRWATMLMTLRGWTVVATSSFVANIAGRDVIGASTGHHHVKCLTFSHRLGRYSSELPDVNETSSEACELLHGLARENPCFHNHICAVDLAQHGIEGPNLEDPRRSPKTLWLISEVAR